MIVFRRVGLLGAWRDLINRTVIRPKSLVTAASFHVYCLLAFNYGVVLATMQLEGKVQVVEGILRAINK